MKEGLEEIEEGREMNKRQMGEGWERNNSERNGG
jgi:hypothetical protein